MKINVRTYGELKNTLGEKFVVELEKGSTINTLITKLQELRGVPRGGLLGCDYMRNSGLTILVNGRNIQSILKLETKLKEGDIVTFIPLVVGG